jgi:hypothetical protein
MDTHRTDYLGLLLLLFITMRTQVTQRCHMRLSRWSQVRDGRVERKMAAMLCRIREMWRGNILLMRHENLRKAKKNLTSVAEKAEEADLKPGERNTD